MAVLKNIETQEYLTPAFNTSRYWADEPLVLWKPGISSAYRFLDTESIYRAQQYFLDRGIDTLIVSVATEGGYYANSNG